MVGPERSAIGEGFEAASLTIDLTSDLTDVVLPLVPTGLITGRVVSADGGALPGGLQVAAVLADQGKAIDPIERDRVDVMQNGRFELRGIFGERTLRVLGLGPEWELDKVMSGKTAVPSLSLAAGEELSDITVVLKRR